MKQRIYFTVANAIQAKRVHDELLLAQIEHRHIHALAKDGIAPQDLSAASIMHTTDLVHGTETGVAVGGGLGVLAGVALVLFPPAGAVLPLGAILWSTLGGAVFGAWVSGMVGSAIPNSRLRAFEQDIAAGGVLMIVDVPAGRVDEIRRLLASSYPEASDTSLEPTVPAFP